MWKSCKQLFEHNQYSLNPYEALSTIYIFWVIIPVQPVDNGTLPADCHLAAVSGVQLFPQRLDPIQPVEVIGLIILVT